MKMKKILSFFFNVLKKKKKKKKKITQFPYFISCSPHKQTVLAGSLWYKRMENQKRWRRNKNNICVWIWGIWCVTSFSRTFMHLWNVQLKTAKIGGGRGMKRVSEIRSVAQQFQSEREGRWGGVFWSIGNHFLLNIGVCQLVTREKKRGGEVKAMNVFWDQKMNNKNVITHYSVCVYIYIDR